MTVEDDNEKQELAELKEKLRKRLASNDRQIRLLKSRMAKLELELDAVRKSANLSATEVAGLKAKR